VCKNKNFTETVDIYINDILIKDLKVNKYPSFQNEIIMSTIVKNVDEYIVQWIEYNKLLGIKRFIIYDNCKNNKENSFFPSKYNESNLKEKLKDYISEKVVVLIDWSYSDTFQQTQQNHSIYTFQKSKLIGFFDVDEYLNPQKGNNNIESILDNILVNVTSLNDIGGFSVLCKYFYNPLSFSEDGYDFLKIYNCRDIIYPNVTKKTFNNE
jgi:hypothetical protein